MSTKSWQPPYDSDTDGRLQVMAGVSLLEQSGLVRWIPESARFEANSNHDFESSVADSAFGRLAGWIMFSAGAEMLPKGVLLLNKIEIRSRKPVYEYPQMGLGHWMGEIQSQHKNLVATNFGTLGSLIPELRTFLANDPGAQLVANTYEFLASTIRNRDAHAYVPNVRGGHFDLVSKLFVPCFNLIASRIPGDPSIISQWIPVDEAREFVHNLP